jgi:histidyl-tRNA synthetase
MVFEVFDTNPENSRAMFGGGRYDGLVGLFGIEPISAVGFAAGGTVFENFLITHGLMPKLSSTTDIYLSVLGDVSKEANKLAYDLRNLGINVELDDSGRKLDKQIKIALKKAVPYILFFGENEATSEVYTLKDLHEAKEYKLRFAEIAEKIKEK